MNKPTTYFGKLIIGGTLDADRNNGQPAFYPFISPRDFECLLNGEKKYCVLCCISFRCLTCRSTTLGRPAPPLSPLSRLNTEHQFSMYVVLCASRCTTCEMSQLPTAVQIGTVDRGAGGGPPLVPPGGTSPTSHTPKMPSSPTFVVPPG